MTREDIITLARAADLIDFRDADSDPHVAQMVEFLQRFATLVADSAAAKEREACAQAIEDMATQYAMGSVEERLLERAAEAIRARSQQ